MVAPFVIYGAWCLGGAIAGALAGVAITKLTSSDKKQLEEYKVKYEELEKERQLAQKKWKNAKEQLEGEIAKLELTIKKQKLEMESLKLANDIRKAQFG